LLVYAGITCVILAVLTGCAAPLSGSISEDGSLNVQPLAEKLAASFIAQHPQVFISIKGSSTAAGIEAVDAGIVDIGGASRELKPGEPSLVAHLLAKDGIAIIVNQANPVESLTISQIRDILAGKIVNWKEVGGADQVIHIVTREEATSTRSVIEETVMRNYKISGGAIIKLSNEAQKKAVVDDPQAIGYNPFAASLDGGVKALSIESIAATKENARNGTYPLIRPLYFLTKDEPKGLVKTFIDFCLSSEGQQLVDSLGYIPVR
jgi:phosphate transport system substrate-binding protein